MKVMAYVTCWDSYTNDASQHYLSIAIPHANIPGNPEPVVFRHQIGQAVHEALCEETGESLDDWKVTDCREPLPGLFVVTLINKENTDVSTYSVRFAP